MARVNLKNKAAFAVKFKCDDRYGNLADISKFFAANNVDILYVKAVSDVNVQKIDIYSKQPERGVPLFMEFLNIFCSEQTYIHKYSAFVREGKSLILLLEREGGFNHKKLLIKTASELSETLIDHIRKKKELVYDIPPNVFEELVAEIFASHGFKVELTKRSRDGGKDIIAVKYDLGIPSAWIVECKRFRKKKIDVRLVRELFGVKQATGYDHAVLVTTSTFTEPAREFESTVWGLSLKDYSAIMEWLNAYSFSESGGLFLATNKPITSGRLFT